MDPAYQVEESSGDTFAATVAGIELLRRTHVEPDWEESRMSVFRSMRSGERLEKDVQALRQAVAARASAEVVSSLVQRVKALEDARAERRKAIKSLLTWAAGVVSVVIAGVILAWVGRHFG